MTDNKLQFHPIAETVVKECGLPEQFTYPFHYTPHPLCIHAAEQVKEYIGKHKEWHAELEAGKMFGVLIARNTEGKVGFFAAFSGILDGKNNLEFFVPPVYDLLDPAGFFKLEEQAISDINQSIRRIEESPELISVQEKLTCLKQQSEKELYDYKTQMISAKALRDKKRKDKLTSEEEAALIKESQFMKAQYKRMEKHWENIMNCHIRQEERIRLELNRLKQERRQRSAALQEKLFRQFILLNAHGTTKDIYTIFKEYGRGIPPAGTGECAAPKLLQHAYRYHFQPLAMAEFWWGNSPLNEIRRHGNFYPSCRSKCEPLLKYMLHGLDVESDPLTEETMHMQQLSVVYEDKWITVVNKPGGMLSVPGKLHAPSVLQWAREHYPDADGPIIVHRLDMDTSGLLILAKSKDTHKRLQDLFEKRLIKKRYIALLDGNVMTKEGFIRLPICSNPNERPMQMVDSNYGKPSVTRYVVIGKTNGYTRVAFYPLTGRTHQLRLHAAHPEGLNAPILGDRLYGKQARRLYLHAESIMFIHPMSGKRIHLTATTPF